MILGLDTATVTTAAGLLGDGIALERRDEPQPGDRPGHAQRLLAFAHELVAEAGVTLAEIERIAVDIGPGGFTGLRIGLSTARALAQATGAELVGVGSLAALAHGAPADRPLAAVIDARRGEVFAAIYPAGGGAPLLEPVALAPDALAEQLVGLSASPLAVGDGAVRFRSAIEPTGALIPDDADPMHRISALAICKLGAQAPPVDRDGLLPDYLRRPDAKKRTT